MSISEPQTLPRREPGLWMDSTDEIRTLAGCDTCGWGTVGKNEHVRKHWVTHTHDPLDDIRTRLARRRSQGHSDSDYLNDVEYLLSVIEDSPRT